MVDKALALNHHPTAVKAKRAMGFTHTNITCATSGLIT